MGSGSPGSVWGHRPFRAGRAGRLKGRCGLTQLQAEKRLALQAVDDALSMIREERAACPHQADTIGMPHEPVYKKLRAAIDRADVKGIRAILAMLREAAYSAMIFELHAPNRKLRDRADRFADFVSTQPPRRPKKKRTKIDAGKAYTMYLNDASFGEIATALGCSKSGAERAVKRVQADVNKPRRSVRASQSLHDGIADPKAARPEDSIEE